jgi:eukaryotic-like serine/threonine-protein kinase
LTTAPSDPFALIGQVLEGQYRVEEVVGEGGCGVVYKGWHIAFEQPVAVKALKMPDVTDAEMRIDVLTKFRDEAKLCYVLSQASLSIVRCIAYGALVTPTQAWAPYLVLEWLEGRPLSDELEERRKNGAPGRSLSDAMAMLGPVAAGLTYAHSQRVAHRDVKPGNLFVVGEGTPATTLKILDFGIAKVMEEGATAHSAPWTKGGAVSFTPYYAAPEQLDPRFGPTGPWTDVYGFALVMVEVISGKRPMRGPDVVSVIAQATNPAQRPTPRALGVAVPDAVEAAFAKALALAPKARFPEMGAFWDALTAATKLGQSTSGRHSDGALAAASFTSPKHTVPMAGVTSPSGGGHAPIPATMEMKRAEPVDQPSSPRVIRLAPPTPSGPLQSGPPSSDPRPPVAVPRIPPPPARPKLRRWLVLAGTTLLLVGAGLAYASTVYECAR